VIARLVPTYVHRRSLIEAESDRAKLPHQRTPDAAEAPDWLQATLQRNARSLCPLEHKLKVGAAYEVKEGQGWSPRKRYCGVILDISDVPEVNIGGSHTFLTMQISTKNEKLVRENGVIRSK